MSARAPHIRVAILVAVTSCVLHGIAAGTSCPPTGATLTIVVDNRSADETVTVDLSGTRIVESGACDAGANLVTSYATSLTCTGSGEAPCGRITGLAPGRWIHRMSTQVVGSAVQRQTTRNVLLAPTVPGVSNVTAWTIHGRTFVIDAATDTTLLAALDAAGAYATSTARPALVRFDPAIFPGAASPTTIDVKHAVVQPGNQHVCGSDAVCSDGRRTTYCLEASGITIDALDDEARSGGVVLRVGTCRRSLLRVYGDDVVLRGVDLVGSENATPDIPLDTIVFSGGTRRSRLERCRVSGPTRGDAVSVENDAGSPLGGVPSEIVIADSEILGAEDKGVKAAFGGNVRIERTCIHDNQNGGVQATLGGTVTAIENVVQHNVGGSAGNGLFAGVPMAGSAVNRLVTRGNVVRLNGARGVSIVNTGMVTLAHDVVTDNYQAGVRVESAVPGEQPRSVVRGTAVMCNFAPGACGDGRACRVDDECSVPPCVTSPSAALANGVGAAVIQCLQPGCLPPVTDFGVATDEGRNAFALNANPAAPAPGGTNFNVALADVVTIPAAGNQWQHCSTPSPDPIDPTRCFVDQIATLDIRPSRSPLELGQPVTPLAAPAPIAMHASPGRPGAGDTVRLYGEFFDAIGAAACLPPGLPADPCSVENAAVVARSVAANGTHVLIADAGTVVSADVQAVTPTMLVFTMPFDCAAPTTIVVDRGGIASAPLLLCDPGGCVDGRPGSPCDDLDDVCTVDDRCDADGRCTGGTLDCDDGDGCTTDACTPGVGCAHVVRPDGATCGASDACKPAPTCQSGVCTADVPPSCDDGNVCTDDGCDAATGCTHVLRAGVDGITCHFLAIRTILGDLPTTRRIRKLLTRIARSEGRIVAAAAADTPARQRRLARHASRCLQRYLHLLDRTRSITDALRVTLRNEGNGAREGIATTFGLP